MKILTPAQMHTFAEYALEHIYILNGFVLSVS